jgi:hypothetical protein
LKTLHYIIIVFEFNKYMYKNFTFELYLLYIYISVGGCYILYILGYYFPAFKLNEDQKKYITKALSLKNNGRTTHSLYYSSSLDFYS